MEKIKKLLGLERDFDDLSTSVNSTTRYQTFHPLQMEDSNQVTIQLGEKARDGSFKTPKESVKYETYNTNFNYPLLDVNEKKV